MMPVTQNTRPNLTRIELTSCGLKPSFQLPSESGCCKAAARFWLIPIVSRAGIFNEGEYTLVALYFVHRRPGRIRNTEKHGCPVRHLLHIPNLWRFVSYSVGMNVYKTFVRNTDDYSPEPTQSTLQCFQISSLQSLPWLQPSPPLPFRLRWPQEMYAVPSILCFPPGSPENQADQSDIDTFVEDTGIASKLTSGFSVLYTWLYFHSSIANNQL